MLASSKGSSATFPPATLGGRRHVRFTPADFWSLHEQGMLPERCELVDGEIFEMPPQHWPAVRVIGATQRRLEDAWHDPQLVGSHFTHVFPGGWQPMPDVVTYDAHPPRRSGVGVAYPIPRLVVEVADETLDYDLGEKARRYAAEGLPEWWVADVNGRRLHVHREAIEDDWRVRLLFRPGDTISPLCLPGVDLPVADLLPDV